MSTSKLFRLSAVAGLISGLALAADNLLDLVGNFPTEILEVISAALGLFLLTGLYLWHRDRVGVFGALAYVVVSIGLSVLVGLAYSSTFVFEYLQGDVLGELMGGPTGTVFMVSVIIYLTGAILFGISIVAAGVFSWIPALLFVAGFVLNLLWAFLPHTLIHIGGILAGAGIFWFAVSLWSQAARNSR